MTRPPTRKTAGMCTGSQASIAGTREPTLVFGCTLLVDLGTQPSEIAFASDSYRRSPQGGSPCRSATPRPPTCTSATASSRSPTRSSKRNSSSVDGSDHRVSTGRARGEPPPGARVSPIRTSVELRSSGPGQRAQHRGHQPRRVPPGHDAARRPALTSQSGPQGGPRPVGHTADRTSPCIAARRERRVSVAGSGVAHYRAGARTGWSGSATVVTGGAGIR